MCADHTKEKLRKEKIDSDFITSSKKAWLRQLRQNRNQALLITSMSYAIVRIAVTNHVMQIDFKTAKFFRKNFTIISHVIIMSRR